VHKCPACGFAPERQSAIEERSGSLVQLNGRRQGKENATPHDRQQVYSMLLWLQNERGYKSGFAKAKFMARYGQWPRGLGEFPIAPDAALLNWLKSQEIAFRKRRQKDSVRAA
jgi:hypothetical protein